ncbi:MAG: hypothetical protein LUF02_10460 [Erysipelotrichaceae bacterium]|nr:hypothetical protein [Erysipelotrichaceae bacterium]
MDRFHFLADRYYKYFKNSCKFSLVSLIIFVILTLIGTDIRYIFLLLFYVTLVEAVILYILYFIFKKRK